jgi:hypothetical protein
MKALLGASRACAAGDLVARIGRPAEPLGLIPASWHAAVAQW